MEFWGVMYLNMNYINLPFIFYLISLFYLIPVQNDSPKCSSKLDYFLCSLPPAGLLRSALTNSIMWTPSRSYRFVHSPNTFLAPHPHRAFSRLISFTKITLGILPQAESIALRIWPVLLVPVVQMLHARTQTHRMAGREVREWKNSRRLSTSADL